MTGCSAVFDPDDPQQIGGAGLTERHPSGDHNRLTGCGKSFLDGSGERILVLPGRRMVLASLGGVAGDYNKFKELCKGTKTLIACRMGRTKLNPSHDRSLGMMGFATLNPSLCGTGGI
jgi:hypothetical protein